MYKALYTYSHPSSFWILGLTSPEVYSHPPYVKEIYIRLAVSNSYNIMLETLMYVR